MYAYLVFGNSCQEASI